MLHCIYIYFVCYFLKLRFYQHSITFIHPCFISNPLELDIPRDSLYHMYSSLNIGHTTRDILFIRELQFHIQVLFDWFHTILSACFGIIMTKSWFTGFTLPISHIIFVIICPTFICLMYWFIYTVYRHMHSRFPLITIDTKNKNLFQYHLFFFRHIQFTI